MKKIILGLTVCASITASSTVAQAATKPIQTQTKPVIASIQAFGDKGETDVNVVLKVKSADDVSIDGVEMDQGDELKTKGLYIWEAEGLTKKPQARFGRFLVKACNDAGCSTKKLVTSYRATETQGTDPTKPISTPVVVKNPPMLSNLQVYGDYNSPSANVHLIMLKATSVTINGVNLTAGEETSSGVEWTGTISKDPKARYARFDIHACNGTDCVDLTRTTFFQKVEDEK